VPWVHGARFNRSQPVDDRRSGRTEVLPGRLQIRSEELPLGFGVDAGMSEQAIEPGNLPVQ
jgi:hypothetical protein